MKLGEFFVSIGVNANTKKLKEFIGDLGEMNVGTLANISSVAALALELIKLGTEATNASVGFKMFRDQTGLSSQELQKWQIVAAQSNVSTEAVASSVGTLQRNLAEIRLGRGNISPFQMMGISSSGNAFDVLRQFRANMGRYDAATTTNLASQMGITPEMITLLKLSDTEFNKLSNTVRGLTTGQEEQFLRTKQSLVQLGMQFKYLGFDIAYHFIHFFEKFINWIKQVPVHMPTLIASLVLLTAALFPLQTLMVSLLLLFDDLAVYFSGGKSLTGVGIEGLKKMGHELKDAFNIPSLAKLTEYLATTGSLGPVGSLAAAGVNGARTLANTFNINVTGAGSAVDIANEVTRQITSHFSDAEQELNNQGH